MDLITTVCGLEELPEHSGARVSHVLSILDPGWPAPEAFGAYGEHVKLELRFQDVIEEALGTIPPEEEDVVQILEFGRSLTSEPGARLLVHCHAGISRSTAAMALILAQAEPRRPAPDILGGILATREKAWPNLRILEIGDALLGRGGTLPKAAAALYRHQLNLRPHLAGVMRKAGRGREVDAGEALG